MGACKPATEAAERIGLAAARWQEREQAAVAAPTRFSELARRDGAIDLLLAELRELPGAAEACAAALACAPGSAGALFVAAARVIGDGAVAALAPILDACGDDVALGTAVAAALVWLPWQASAAALPALLRDAAPPAWRRIGIAACRGHGICPDDALAPALHSDDAPLRAVALGTIGALGRAELAALLPPYLHDPSEACVLAAARALARFGDDAATDTLRALAEAGGPRAGEACGVLVRRLARAEAVRLLFRLGATRGGRRAAIAGIAELGALRCVPWLIEWLDDGEHAELAAEAYALVTGTPVARPYDRGAVLAAWNEHGRPDPNARHLTGQERDSGWLATVLSGGAQHARRVAALDLELAHPQGQALDVAAPAHRQLAWLASAAVAGP